MPTFRRSNDPSRKNSSRKIEANRRRKRRASTLRMEGLERRDMMAVAIFQQGMSGYEGQSDTVLYSREPSVNAGTEGSISPDQQDANGVRQGLVRFDDIFGTGPGQIPVGSTINSATLLVQVVNDSNSSMQMSAYRMLTPWDESTATWDGFGAIGGIQASEDEATSLPPDWVLFDPDTNAENPATAGRFDVTKSLRYWAAGQANLGWMLESASTNGWDFRTKESAQGQRPQLTIDFTAPSGAGSVGFLALDQLFPEGDSGSSVALLDVSRSGGVAGSISVDYTITAGTATGGDDFVLGSGTLTFAAGDALEQVPVTITGDTSLEGWESITVSLTNPTGGATIRAGRDTETLTIADNDALISEVLANVSNSASDETNREYIELVGTPGASLDGYYFVVFEGEEEEGAVGANGAGAGRADFVVNLTGQTFGSNGLLVITSTNWAYTASAETNRMIVPALDAVGGLLEDSSQTYALIRSPNAPIVQGTDYDTIGVYEDATNQAFGVGVGILDQLPAGAVLADSVGVVEGGGGDRDRTLVTPPIGQPGIHVHQPTQVNAASGGVTSDGVTRRSGQRLPNSIGAWYNGDVTNGTALNGQLQYLNDTFFISVVAPDGSTMTPGTPNFARAVFFRVADQSTEVAESTGSVTLRIERTGDVANESVDVTYRTVDFGSATSNVDYTNVQQTITFAPGEAFKEVTIQLLGDSISEGFERFRVDIISATGGYQIGDGRATLFDAINGEAVVTIADANVSTARFQNGVNGYFGTQDATLDGELSFDSFGQDTVVRVDQVKGEGEDTPLDVRPQQGLIRFDNLFGSGPGQVPFGAQIFDAFVTVNVTNLAAGASVNFFRMLQDWDELSSSWIDPQGDAGGSILNGVTPDGVEATSAPDGTVSNPGRTGRVQIAIDTDTLQSWANGSASNYGWSIVSDSGSLWSFNSSEAFQIGTFRPELTILYNPPTVAAAGVFELASGTVSVAENAGSAQVTVHRIGGSAGPATVNWSIANGTTSAADFGATSGSVNFADGELFKTFNVAVINDPTAERNESATITIAGAGLTFGRTSESIEVRDNDFNVNSGVLLNELWINSPGNDPPHEFVEIVGPASLPLGSLYYVAIEGLIGDREGVAEKVVKLGDFANGSTGYTVVTPDAADFAFNVPVGTTQIDRLGPIATENVASQNDSTTYMLLYSPAVDLTTTSFDYDWDNDGSLELPAGVQIIDSLGVRVLGAQDLLYGPSTGFAAFAVSDPEVDAVSRQRGNTQRSRGSAWFGGDLQPGGDDYLLYEAAESFGLPSPGAALTPGEVNVGTPVQSPLVSIQSVVVNPNGTATVTFSAPVTQALIGDQGFVGPEGTAIAVTSQAGLAIAGIDVLPTISGLGSNTLQLSFTGPATVGGGLPTGSYRLNFVGNALIANGRAVDAAATGANGTDRQFGFTVAATTLVGDYNGDGFVNAGDYTVWRDSLGSTTNLAANGDNTGASAGVIDQADYAAWVANYGASAPATALAVLVEEEPASAPLSVALVDAVFASMLDEVATPIALAVAADTTEESLDAMFAVLGSAIQEAVAAPALGVTTPAGAVDSGDLLLIRDSGAAPAVALAEFTATDSDPIVPSKASRAVFKPGIRGLRG
ncbi:MAG: Calx-beta domain-containing protein [Lacipirellulaceae bacterium]